MTATIAAQKAWETMNARKVSVNTDAVTFGIEIECALPYQYVQNHHIAVGTYHRGTQLPAPFPQGWTAQHDGSLHFNSSGLVPMEIVSPVLKGLDGLEQVKTVVSFIESIGGKVNESCGQHVHVGLSSILGDKASDFDFVAEYIRRLLNLTSQHEFALFALGGTRTRLFNRYCASIKGHWAGKIKPGDKMDKVRREIRDRYFTLNLLNLFDPKRTIEFRIFAGTLNWKKSLGYIVTAIALCQRAAESPIAPTFDGSQVEPADYEKMVERLHKAIDGHGYPTGANKFKKEIQKNQIWNANKFANERGGTSN